MTVSFVSVSLDYFACVFIVAGMMRIIMRPCGWIVRI